MLLLGPEQALGIPRCSAREAFKNWTECQHCAAWKDLLDHRHGKLFISRPWKNRGEDLLKLSRHQLRMVVAFFTGNAPVKKHLHIMGMFDGNLNCRFCRMELFAEPNI
jgi:hypothetical protein